jgi:hypothetical protein
MLLQFKPTLSLAEVFIFFLIFSPAVMMSQSSKTTNLFEILISYCSLIYASMSFFTLNLFSLDLLTRIREI